MAECAGKRKTPVMERFVCFFSWCAPPDLNREPTD
jgi:hypothetical protein